MTFVDLLDETVPVKEPFTYPHFEPNVGDIVHVWKPVGVRFTRNSTFQTSEKLEGKGILATITPDIDLLIVKKHGNTTFMVKIIDSLLSFEAMNIAIRVHANHLNRNSAYNKNKEAK